MKIQLILISILVFVSCNLDQEINSKPKGRIIEEIKDLNSLSQLKENSNQTIVLFLGSNDSDEFQEFKRVYAKSNLLVWSNSLEIKSQYNLNKDDNEILIFKYSDNKNTFKEGKIANIRNSVKSQKVFAEKIKLFTRSEISVLTEKSLSSILDSGFPTLFLFVGDNHVPALNKLNLLNKKYRGELRFVIGTLNSESIFLLDGIINPRDLKVPQALIIDGLNIDYASDHKKYISKEQLDLEKELEEFVEDFLKGKLNNVVFSEDINEIIQDENGINTVVQKTFDKFIKLNLSKDIILLFCSKNVEECKILRERFVRVTKKFENSKNFVSFAEIDPSKNDIETINLSGIPNVLILPKIKLGNIKTVAFQGNFTTRDISEFIRKESKNKLNETILENEEEIHQEEVKNLIFPSISIEEEKEQFISNPNEVEANLNSTEHSENEVEEESEPKDNQSEEGVVEAENQNSEENLETEEIYENMSEEEKKLVESNEDLTKLDERLEENTDASVASEQKENPSTRKEDL